MSLDRGAISSPERGKNMARFIMWLCHRQYKKYGMPIFYIKGTGKDYPNYLIYTEDKNIYERMDRI